GSDCMIFFGVPVAHTNDPLRAADAALAIRDVINQVKPVTVAGREITITSQIGISCGPAFAAEIGEPRGRREFNLLGDTVNVAARLMSRALPNQILLTGSVCRQITSDFEVEELPPMELKGKSASLPVF